MPLPAPKRNLQAQSAVLLLIIPMTLENMWVLPILLPHLVWLLQTQAAPPPTRIPLKNLTCTLEQWMVSLYATMVLPRRVVKPFIRKTIELFGVMGFTPLDPRLTSPPLVGRLVLGVRTLLWVKTISMVVNVMIVTERSSCMAPSYLTPASECLAVEPGTDTDTYGADSS